MCAVGSSGVQTGLKKVPSHLSHRTGTPPRQLQAGPQWRGREERAWVLRERQRRGPDLRVQPTFQATQVSQGDLECLGSPPWQIKPWETWGGGHAGPWESLRLPAE